MNKPFQFLNSVIESYKWKYTKLNFNEFKSTGPNGVILFIHGRNSGKYSMYKIGKFFSNLGFGAVFAEYNHGESAINAINKINDLVDSLEVKPLTIISHSKGGLIAIEYVSTLTACSIKRIFTLSCPYGGTIYTKIPFIKFFKDIKEFLKPIRVDLKKSDIQVINIYGKWDEMILPSKNLYDPFADVNMEFDIYGHNATIFNNQVYNFIYSYLK